MLPWSVSGVAEDILDVEGLCELLTELRDVELEPKLDAELELDLAVGRLGLGGGLMLAASSVLCAWALRRLSASLSRNCLVASLGSEARYAQGQQTRNRSFKFEAVLLLNLSSGWARIVVQFPIPHLTTPRSRSFVSSSVHFLRFLRDRPRVLGDRGVSPSGAGVGLSST